MCTFPSYAIRARAYPQNIDVNNSSIHTIIGVTQQTHFFKIFSWSKIWLPSFLLWGSTAWFLTLAKPVTRWYKPVGMGSRTTVAGRLWGFRWGDASWFHFLMHATQIWLDGWTSTWTNRAAFILVFRFWSGNHRIEFFFWCVNLSLLLTDEGAITPKLVSGWD